MNNIPLYNLFKWLHFLSAALFLMSFAISCVAWLTLKKNHDTLQVVKRIHSHTWFIMLPTLLFQSVTGFAMIHFKQYNVKELWIMGTLLGSIILIGSWFGFVYSLLTSCEYADDVRQSRKMPFFLLTLSSLALLSILFLMSNRVSL